LWDDVVISHARAAEELDAALATAERDNLGYWSIRTHSEGAVIGDCGFQFIDDSRQVELMCCLLELYSGQGLAREACSAALSYLWASSAFERVYARVDIPNESSLRLMRRLGMTELSRDGWLITHVLDRSVQELPG
jgi:RimJ/RimL family protein N-acetyltransferase